MDLSILLWAAAAILLLPIAMIAAFKSGNDELNFISKIKIAASLGTFNQVCQRIGSPNEIEYDKNGNMLCSWVIRNPYYITYKCTLKFEPNSGRNLGKVYEIHHT